MVYSPVNFYHLTFAAMKMLRILSVLVFMSFPLVCRAQFNDSVFYRLNLVASGTFNKTKEASNYLLNNALRFGIRKRSVSLNLSGGWIYGLQQDQLTNNDVNSALDFNLYKGPEGFYYWGLGHYTSSLSLKINNQYQGGLGIAYSLVV